MAFSKITVNGITNLDVTATTATADKILTGYGCVGADGVWVDGSYTAPTARTASDVTVSGATVTIPAGAYASQVQKSVASGTAGTPTASKGTVSNHAISVTPSVTNTTGYITGGTKNGTAVSVSASELVSGTLSITSSGTADVTNYASASVAAGSATASASKGTVSNHSISVTPSVTRTAGYVTAGSANGTAVTVSASELVSGSETKTVNGTYDVTNLAEIVVNVSGGGTSDVQAALAQYSSLNATSVSFSPLYGEPTSFLIISNYDIATSSTPTLAALVYDGTGYNAEAITNTSNAQVSHFDTGFQHSYSNGVLNVSLSNSTVRFQTGPEYQYLLMYTYGGTAGNIQTADVQVGSGATSITFSDLEDEPVCWSCIFKSNFSTSSGYQRVICTTGLEGDIIGIAMDSGAHVQQSWTSSYSNGSLTITSQGTNAGGYFHQPGYYQLTYAVAGSGGNYQSKTVTPTESQQVVQADSGYDALKKVTVDPIPSQYIVPTGNIAITSNTTGSNTLDVSQYATATVNVPTSGSSMNVQTAQSTTRSTSTSGTNVISLTCSKAGTYTVRWSTFRSSTSGTWGSRLYIGGTAYETMNTSGWSNHIQNREVTGVSISANQAVAVYVQSRGNSYYGYVGTLTIIQTA